MRKIHKFLIMIKFVKLIAVLLIVTVKSIDCDVHPPVDYLMVEDGYEDETKWLITNFKLSKEYDVGGFIENSIERISNFIHGGSSGDRPDLMESYKGKDPEILFHYLVGLRGLRDPKNGVLCTGIGHKYFINTLKNLFDGNLDELNNHIEKRTAPKENSIFYRYLKGMANEKYKSCLSYLELRRGLGAPQLNYDINYKLTWLIVPEDQSANDLYDWKMMQQLLTLAEKVDFIKGQFNLDSLRKNYNIILYEDQQSKVGKKGLDLKTLVQFVDRTCNSFASNQGVISLLTNYNLARLFAPRDVARHSFPEDFLLFNEYWRICIQFKDPKKRFRTVEAIERRFYANKGWFSG